MTARPALPPDMRLARRSEYLAAFAPHCARPLRSQPSRRLLARPLPRLHVRARVTRMVAETGTPAKRPSDRALSLNGDAPPGHVHLRLFGLSATLPARVVLLAVPFLWGTLPPVGKLLSRLGWALSPAAFNAIRLSLSFLCVSGAVARELKPPRAADTRSLLLAGAELGLWTFLTSTLQLVGVRYTSASRAAFLTQLQTVLVPLLAAASGDRSALSRRVLGASLLALAGVAALTLDSAAAPLSIFGDGAMLLCAVFGAVFVLRTRAVASRLRSAPLVAYKVLFQLAFAIVFTVFTAFTHRDAAAGAAAGGFAALFAGATPMLLLVNAALVLWAGVFVSAGSSWLHVKANTVVSAPESAVIFSFTPLWASLCAVFLGERFGLKGVLGGALIVLSTILSSGSDEKEEDDDKLLLGKAKSSS